MQEILINNSIHETRVALLVDGVLQELRIERNSNVSRIGNIYLGVVAKVLPGMQSAFVDIGLDRAGFLHVADMRQAYQDGALIPIERLLHDGQIVLVQVAKDPIGTKGARLTTEISLAGRFLVYLPFDSRVGISQKIEDEEERLRLRETVENVAEGVTEQNGAGGGYIVRTSAEVASIEDFESDARYLNKLWRRIEERTHVERAPALLHGEISIAEKVLRDMVSEKTDAIVVDSKPVLEELQHFAQNFVPEAEPLLTLYDKERPLFDQYNLEPEIEASLSRRVDLKSGGYLIIDQTEAMTTIDVNTGAFVGRRDFSDTIYKTNLEATHAIARQLRLRNLGGIIIVDFIDMDRPEHQAGILSELRKAISEDHNRITVSEFTELGLVQITRKRTRESLAHVLCEPCPYCGGKGEMKTARTVCYEILREVLREHQQFKDAKEFRIMASQSVIDLFLEEESEALALLGDAIQKPIRLQLESAYYREQYDVLVL